MKDQKRTYRYHAYTEQDTEILAALLSEDAFPGMVIALDGDLGAGKTRFSQAFAKSMGVNDIVSSPTFTLIKEYIGSQYPLFHMDVYRISVEEAEGLGLDEYFYGEGVSLVEWASRITDLLPSNRLNLHIEYVSEQERRFILTPCGQAYIEKCRLLRQNGVIE